MNEYPKSRTAIFVLLSILFISMLYSAPASMELSEEYWEQVANIKANGIFHEARSPVSGEKIRLSGTPYLIPLSNKDIRIPEYLKPYVGFRPVLPESYDTPDGHFKIHYAVTGDSAVLNPNVDVNPADGVPDYVNLIADIAGHVWAKEIDSMGYQAPPADDWYPTGGDSLYDIYIVNLPPNYFGYTEADNTNYDLNPAWTSFLVLDNDYSNVIWLTPTEAIQVTAAHEFFHAIQIGYDRTEVRYYNGYPTVWWYEVSSVWMEDQVYDDVNDYLNYLPYFFRYPHLGLETDGAGDIENIHKYSCCVWPMFLTERFDTDIMREIWEGCAEHEGFDALNETNEALVNRASSLNYAFREFAVWNYFTGNRANLVPDSMRYEEAHTWPSFPDSVIAVISSYSSPPDTVAEGNEVPRFPDYLAANYVRFNVNGERSGGIKVGFNGSIGPSWEVALVGFNGITGQYDPEIKYFLLNRSWVGFEDIRSWTRFTEVLMIPAVVGTRIEGIENSYAYFGEYADTLIGDEPLPSGNVVSQNAPNPFDFSSGVTETYFPFELKQYGRPRIKIYTVAGEFIKKIEPMIAGDLPPGIYDSYLSWDGKNENGELVAGGVYVYIFYTDDFSEVKKLVVIR